MRSLPAALLAVLCATVVGACGGSDAGSVEEGRSVLVDVARAGDEALGDRVTVAGEVVRGGNRAFVLEAEGEQVLVVLLFDPPGTFEVGQVVSASGRVSELRASPEGDEELVEQFGAEPAVAARSADVID